MTDITNTAINQTIRETDPNQTEKYFAYIIPYTDTRVASKKLTASGVYPINRETVISLEEESINLGKSVILCKVTSMPISNTNTQHQSGYTEFTTNQSYQLEGNAKSKIFGANSQLIAPATHIHTFEYMYIPISNSFQFKSYQSILYLYQDDTVSDCKRTLASLVYICSEFPFSQIIGRKFDIYDLTDTEEMCRNISQTSQLYNFINSFTLQEDMIAQIWNASFAYGACVRTNMSSYTNNSPANLDIISNSLFDFAFENYDRFANNIANGNLFSRYYGVDAADTINIPVFMGCTPSYRCVVSFYHKNDVPNITISDVMGNLVGRQYKLPAGQFHPGFQNIADRHYFPGD